ncbi:MULTISPECIES: hypothetical protein [unclassified Sphingomonas]|uniref:hypothetical protein n=1 Tax=unclassified Sphingomonas TaxID=196159 RepID=UPI000E735FED|nr:MULTISPECIES: hypothetical protein [unclassified Sphingomonas]RKE50622.1 hypothetical protein C8J39_2193 [Sphingomonas sp. PP-CC-1A-547]TCM08917.1 hypothetical protein C8J41_102896 [Sphingomonas sp. PP-CC-3G-468]
MSRKSIATAIASVSLCAFSSETYVQSLTVSPAETLETQALSVIVGQNQFSPIRFAAMAATAEVK